MNKHFITQYELKKIQALLSKNGDEVVEVAVKTSYQILDRWKVSLDDKDTLVGCVNGIQPNTDEFVIRASIIISIYSSLHTIFKHVQQADTWPCKPNSAFGQKSAIEYMRRGINNMREVQKYLLAYQSQ